MSRKGTHSFIVKKLMSCFRRRTHLLRVVGQFVAKAMLDSRIIDMSFNKVFLKLVLGADVPLTIDTLKVSPVSWLSRLSLTLWLAR